MCQCTKVNEMQEMSPFLLITTTLTYSKVIELWHHRNSPSHRIQMCSQLAHGDQRFHANNLQREKTQSQIKCLE